MKNLKFLQFENLTIISRLENGTLLARCKCGRERQCIVGSWNAKRYLSCKECSKKKMSLLTHKRFSKGKEGLFNRLIGAYKSRASRQNIEFNLTEEQFRVLIHKNCYYCDIEPSQNAKNRVRKSRMFNDKDDFLYTGIDRLDHKLGYTTDNCVSCCEQCNRAKFTMSHDEYLSFVNRFRHGGFGFEE